MKRKVRHLGPATPADGVLDSFERLSPRDRAEVVAVALAALDQDGLQLAIASWSAATKAVMERDRAVLSYLAKVVEALDAVDVAHAKTLGSARWRGGR